MTIQQAFEVALQHHQSGKLGDAEAIYRQILTVEPRHANALHFLGVIAHQVGRNDVAMELIRQAIALAPGVPDFHSNLGEACRAAGQADEAIVAYRQAIACKPTYPEAHYNLGNALRDKGQSDEAIAAYRQAIALKPDYSAAHINLGNALRDKGQLDEAIVAYRQAIALKPNYPEAHNNLGVALRDKGQVDEAIDAYRQALRLRPDFADAYVNLGNALTSRGNLEESIASFQRAIELSPFLLSAKTGLCWAMRSLIPQWHVPMMNDRMRNEFYCSALKAAVAPDASVLEIGTGSGLLSMMAARLGAMEVTTFEAVPLIAKTARRIISENGLDGRIRVIARKSTEATLGVDMPDKADALIFEIFSSEFLAEGVLSSVEDAKRRLLKPNARIIPAAGSIMIALFGGDEIASNLVVGDSCGFNLSYFNSIISRRQNVARMDLSIELLTDVVEAFRFDFERDSFFPCEEKTLRIPVKTPGRCLGIIQWIRLETGKDLVFENHPLGKSPASSWQHCVTLLPAPVNLGENQTAIISAAHDRKSPWFSLQGVENTSR